MRYLRGFQISIEELEILSDFLLGNINDFDVNKDSIELNNLLELDKWILHELALLQRM
jgi:isoleucyl-tRNA synthetase